jgi:pyruvate-formate lyase-activating enzyme
MVNVIRVERKTAVLTPSSLACLSRIPTVNLTAGCAHGCLYCYTRSYSSYPGEDKVAFYTKRTQRACHIDKPQAIVRQRDITRHVISPISARRAVSGSHLPIAIISVGVRLPRRGSGSAETVPVIIQKYGI